MNEIILGETRDKTLQVPNSKCFALFCYYYEMNRPSCSFQVKQSENINFALLKIDLRPLLINWAPNKFGAHCNLSSLVALCRISIPCELICVRNQELTDAMF